nr:MAG TPA: hypothetical protein [Caudoviricetes sp.]
MTISFYVKCFYIINIVVVKSCELTGKSLEFISLTYTRNRYKGFN